MDLKLAVFSEAVLLGTASSISYVGCYNIISAFTFLVHIVTQTVKTHHYVISILLYNIACLMFIHVVIGQMNVFQTSCGVESHSWKH